jgi:hypothetical protein
MPSRMLALNLTGWALFVTEKDVHVAYVFEGPT